MYIKRVKRKCNVRGCNETDSFAISLTREMGNSVIICKSCLGKALGAIDEINPETKDNIPVVKSSAPPLFFNREISADKELETESIKNAAKADEEAAVSDEETEEKTNENADAEKEIKSDKAKKSKAKGAKQQ